MSRDDLVIRQAFGADLPRLVELFELGAAPDARGVEDPGELARYRAALEEIDAAAGAVLVAERRGEVVGVCQLVVFRHLQARGGLCAELESVHVHPEHRGAGVGVSLVHAAVEQARALGRYRVQLTSNARRERAHRFYESLGFEQTHLGYKLLLERPGGSGARDLPQLE